MPCQVVAEISANHQRSLDRAVKLVAAARMAGADAVKLQTWAPGKMVLNDHLLIMGGAWHGRHMAELYEEALLPWDMQRAVFTCAREAGIECFSSVFDPESLEFLEGLGCPRYKIASCELVDLPLITLAASTGKPLVMSTGMATHVEIERALQAARQGGAKDVTLLKCTAAYPAKAEDANLRTLDYYRRRFNVRVGVSDHTVGVGIGPVAATLGATMIEKHFTIDRREGGLDAAFSVEPPELRALVQSVRAAEAAIGEVHFGPVEGEEPQLRLRRSLWFTRSMRAGERVGAGDVRSARPAMGIPTWFYDTVQGAELERDVEAGTPVLWDCFRVTARGA